MVKANYLRVLAAVLTASLAIGLLGLVGTSREAGAAFPGVNGKIVFTSDRDSSGPLNDEIYTINPDGSNPTRLTNNPAVDNFPALSPDGSKIVFVSNRDGNNEIYVMDAQDRDGDGNGDNLARLTNNLVSDANPAFSPDGTRIAFTRGAGLAGEVYIMNADGSDQTNLTNNPAFDGQPVFLPDGTRIAFLSGRGNNNEIYAMNVDGTDQINLTNNPASDSQPNFSPDGSRIAFTSNRDDGNLETYVMGADGSDQTNLTNNPASDRFPAFSPDGTKIAFWRGPFSTGEIYVMDANGSNQTNLTNNPKGDIDPDWGPLIKDLCKKGGFESFGFKNQGNCVSFVATGGKDKPGK